MTVALTRCEAQDAAGKELLKTLCRQGATLTATGCLMRAVVAEITCGQTK